MPSALLLEAEERDWEKGPGTTWPVKAFTAQLVSRNTQSDDLKVEKQAQGILRSNEEELG